MSWMLVVAVIASLALAQSGASNDDPVEALLARVIPAQDEPAPDALLLGLRRLRDPALRPLFGGLADAPRADLRDHGLLGLAEIDDPPRLNLLSVSRIENRVERARVLGEGLRLGFVDPEALPDILNWDDLDPFIELVVRGRILVNGTDAGLDRVRQLASPDTMPLARATALLLLAQAGDEARAIEAADVIASVEGGNSARNAGILLLLDHVRREKLDRCGPFCARLYDLVAPTDRLLALDILGDWLRLDAAQAAPTWTSLMESTEDLGAQLRLALVALDASGDIEPSLTEPFLESSQPLAAELLQLAHALASNDEPSVLEAMQRVLDEGYKQGVRWCATRGPMVRPEMATSIWTLLIRDARERTRPTEKVDESIPLVAEALAEADPEVMRRALADARAVRDEDLTQALLVGLLASGVMPLWETPDRSPWPDPASTSLARLVEAQSAENLAPETIDELRAIARGRGNLPEVFRVQAAWLAIKHEGEARVVLARLLNRPGLRP